MTRITEPITPLTAYCALQTEMGVKERGREGERERERDKEGEETN